MERLDSEETELKKQQVEIDQHLNKIVSIASDFTQQKEELEQ